MNAAWKVAVLVCLIVITAIAIGNEVQKADAVKAAQIARGQAAVAETLAGLGRQ